MAQLGLVIQKDQVEYLYAQSGTIVFSQRNGDFLTWVEGSGISFSDVDSIVVQKDFCQDLPHVQAQVGYCRLQSGDLENLEDLRKKQLAEFDADDVVTPDIELIRNQITRENYWTLNLMLTQRAKAFVHELIEKQKQLGIQAPVYFLTGSGFLTDAKNVLRNPVLTWRSGQVMELLSAARHHHLHDFFYVKKQGETYAIQTMKDGEPINYQNHCNFHGYELPPWFVKISRVKEADLEYAISYLKRIYGDLPLVTEGDVKDKRIQFARYAATRNPMGGLFQIPYRKRLFRQINMAQVKELELFETEVRQALDKYLTRNKINLKDPTYTIIKENWQYSLERIARLELRVVGKLGS